MYQYLLCLTTLIDPVLENKSQSDAFKPKDRYLQGHYDVTVP